MFEHNKKHTTIKAMFVQNLEVFLFEETYKFFKQRLEDLIAKNVVLGGSPIGIYHNRRYLSLYGTGDYRLIPKTKAPAQLVPEIEELLEEYDSISADQNQIANGVSVLLPIKPTYQDVRDALPDYCQCDYLGTLDLPRTRPEAFLIKDNPQKMADWEKTRNVIEKYMVTRFIQT